MANDSAYLLVAVLALAAGLIGVGFKTFLYWLEDFVDELWKGRPEWARPRSAASRSAWCCSRSRRCTGSATR